MVDSMKSGGRPGRLLKVKEVASVLNSSERTVWRLLALGRLAKVKVGRAVRIPLAEVERFISEGGDS